MVQACERIGVAWVALGGTICVLTVGLLGPLTAVIIADRTPRPD